MLIEDGLIRDDVTIQVLVQCRPELLARTFECVQGAPRALIHFYNSTNPIQRRVVFGLEKRGIVEIATTAAALARTLEQTIPDTAVRYEYSPESFTLTEPDFAIEICEAVMDVIEPDGDERRLVLNLPATVECYSPNVYGDVIEWFGRTIKHRDRVVLSVHPHNDRGCAVAAAEFGVMAGAERVEGTLFGNGERPATSTSSHWRSTSWRTASTLNCISVTSTNCAASPTRLPDSPFTGTATSSAKTLALSSQATSPILTRPPTATSLHHFSSPW